MQSTRHTIVSTARAASLLGLLLLAATGATATTQGSTDIYRNEFAASFSTSASNAASEQENGSTDIWGNGFAASFGPSDSGVVSTSGCGTGSTDIWGNGFRASFGSCLAGDVAQARTSGAKELR